MSKKILLVASGGGHWVQLLRLKAAWSNCLPIYMTVQSSYRAQVPGARFYCVPDATRWDRWKLVSMILQVTWIVVKERPNVILTTGAAPGYIAIRVGKFFGIRTVWIDSIANVEAISMSGQKVGAYADLWLTQWEHLAQPAKSKGPKYIGSVL
jgi:UDP-N-acetylglucosamine:LPS N-acetylglucosamine transferase